MSPAACLLLGVSLLPAQAAKELVVDFRDSKLPPIFKYAGPEATTSIKPEPQGLRITLPADRQNKQPVGIAFDGDVIGDFEITAGFEMLHAERPAKGHGVGFELYVMTRTPSMEAVAWSRLMRADDSDVYMSGHMTGAHPNRKYFNSQPVPATAKHGRLRLTRTGKEVVCFLADGDAKEFQEMRRIELGAEDVAMLRLAALTGGDGINVDLRVLDLKVRADNLIYDEAAAVQPVAAQPARPVSNASRRFWLLILGAMALLGASLLVWRLLMRRRVTPSAAAESAGASLQVQCPNCGRRLKLAAQAADRKVRCPGCNTAFVAHHSSSLSPQGRGDGGEGAV